MKRKIYSKFMNSKGERQLVLLNDLEQKIANALQRQIMENGLGFEVDMTILTTVIKRVTEQTYYEVPPADYVPIRVGQAAWSTNILTYRSFNIQDDFETGIINTGTDNTRLASADAGVDSVSVKVSDWAKTISWTLAQLQFASKSGNWDLITAKEESRKKNWDLGIQRIAFLGAKGDSSCLGLLNQSGVTVDTTTLTAPISSLTPDNLKAFIVALVNAYRANCNRTAWPTHFHIPESDYLGLVGMASATYPIKSTLELLNNALKEAIPNGKFKKIQPMSYGDKAYNPGATQQQYVLMNYDESSIRMDVPVDYTNTLANTLNNYQYQNVGFGQFTGVMTYKPDELYYLRF